METKIIETKKKIDSKSLLALGLLIISGIVYQCIALIVGNIPELLEMILEASWNLVLCGIIGYYFLGKISLEQFKHFKFKTLIWGLPLTIIVGMGSGTLYNYIFEPPTTNSVAQVISVSMILTRVPFMLMGEELLCTNIIIALQKLGLKFGTASIICSVLFALWHIPAYGFVPMQLLITIVPVRLLLNYIWKNSKSVWVSWICHLAFDIIGFLPMLFK
ncbi:MULTISPECIES: CPBP family intramembrane glutamic endopeptidase [Bacillus]|uniref:CPBP family intramembrane glutamic endopeptidase n=1 Tax=Bacillus TaxID=1386 RepID=UPI000BF0523F|nr:CPBP family intramembrane glutamic endopeptidase [Bacillus wiedmannii]PEJ45189.1 CPBP family intramembrane metalloprotease [Bacillus wiedmannii]PEM10024.1 CPBP family intramembrane metalloprotease [Bacillus wiedmannii]PFY97267.1 CPBP family intramembrane metalloprotease [Bacillus wiedmannii]PGD95017.1 CPBP family intramembrane metalloprotease [Bacillus wiedmannii]PGE31466.1 CPBP family intramembrane metalloprotease [Bacillus wiedmannii]